MSPDEWNDGARNEADQLSSSDPAWSGETRRYARQERWQSDLGAFALGLAIIQLLVLVIYAKIGGVNRIDAFAQNPSLWMFLTNLPLYAVAGVGAWLLGRRGYRAWPVALAFSLFVALSISTDIAVSAVFNSDFPALYFADFYFSQHSPLEMALVWPLLIGIGYAGARWGAQHPAPKRATR